MRKAYNNADNKMYDMIVTRIGLQVSNIFSTIQILM